MPPPSVTSAAARRIAGTQSGDGHRRDQDLAVLQLPPSLGRAQHAHRARWPRPGDAPSPLHRPAAPRPGAGPWRVGERGDRPRLHEAEVARRPPPTRCPAARRSAPRRAAPSAASSITSASVSTRASRLVVGRARRARSPPSRLAHELEGLVADARLEQRGPSLATRRCRARPGRRPRPRPGRTRPRSRSATRSPVAGSAVNITPERSESTIACTTTAIAAPRSSRWRLAVGDHALRRRATPSSRRTAVEQRLVARTLVKVSCMPANEVPAVSSAVAEERTATRRAAPPPSAR